MSFRSTTYGNRYNRRGFKIDVDRKSRNIKFTFNSSEADISRSDIKNWLDSVNNRTGLNNFSPEPYWGFDDLEHKAGTKLLNTFYVQAEVKREKKQEFYHYKRITNILNMLNSTFYPAFHLMDFQKPLKMDLLMWILMLEPVIIMVLNSD